MKEVVPNISRQDENSYGYSEFHTSSNKAHTSFNKESHVDRNRLNQAFMAAERFDDPYPYYSVKNLFAESHIDELLSLPFQALQYMYTCGTREEFNAYRCYFNKEKIAKFQAAKRVARAFLAQEVIKTLERLGNVCLRDSFLRIEYAIDQDNFWLKPHTDIGVKIVTILLYLSKDGAVENWGTDIYADEQTHVKTFPYRSNTAMMFFPSLKTWHGFEARYIGGMRKSLIINYVTQAWRARDELVHPTRVVSSFFNVPSMSS